MKPNVLITVFLSCLCLGSGSVVADSHDMAIMQLAWDKQCLGCHLSTDDLPRSPSFQSIGQRYGMDEADRLIQVVLTGGEDHWGSAKMPEMGDNRPEVSEEQARRLVQWILGMGHGSK